MTGECAECDEKRLSVQRYASSGTSTPTLFSPAKAQHKERVVQTKLAVSQPGDKFELEADRIAEAVIHRSENPVTVAEEDDHETVQTKLADDITPLVQRQAEAEEEEEDEDEDEEVQTKGAPGEAPLMVGEEENKKLDRLAEELRQAKGNGMTLPPALRGDMEKAFGVDFGQVRVHADRTADHLSRSFHASAFTTGSDIFFREGAFDSASGAGRRLLAHELTHVVQQNPQMRLRSPSAESVNGVEAQDRQGFYVPPAPPVQSPEIDLSALTEVIQRDDPEEEKPSKVFIGMLYLVNGKGEITFKYTVFHSSDPPLKVGRYKATITGEPPDIKLKAKKVVLEITQIDWEEFVEQRKKAKRMYLTITEEKQKLFEEGGGGTEEDKSKDKPAEGTEEGTKKKGEGEKTEGEGEGETTEGDEKGVEGGEGETTDQPPGEKTEEGGEGEPGEEPSEETDLPPGEGGGTEKAPPEPPGDDVPPGEPGVDKPGAPPTEGTEQKEPAAPDQEQKEGGEGKQEQKTGGEVETKGVEGGKEGGTGTGTRPGSKYGKLGWLPLPQEAIDVLEFAFEALGDSEEYLALMNLLDNLSEFDEHAAEMRSWFDDPDKLIRVALGLDTSDAITRLETWVMSAAGKRRRKKPLSKGRGLVGILRKVTRMLEAVRNVLNPIFNTRARFTEAFGAASAILEEIPAFERLLEGEAKPGTPQFEGMLEELTKDFSLGIQHQLAAARATFKGKLEKLGEDDLVTVEELARAILSATRKALPPHARIVARGLDEVGVLGPAADHLVAPLIPIEVLDAINGVLRDVFAALDPAIKAAEKMLDEVISTTESVLQTELTPAIKDVFMPQRTSAVARFEPSSELGLLSLMRRSRGETLERGLRRDLETSMGFDFASVRIHHDFAAQRANQMVRANAFTLGSDIFFGPGNFDPNTDTGRHLLAHELTHVVQQGEGLPTAVIQRDANGLAAEIAKKYAEFLKQAKAFKASPAKKAEAAEMRAQVEEIIAKREHVSRSLKKLPSAYIVVRKKRGKIEIRRKPEWVFLVPKLRVVKNRIEFGFLTKYDPKAGARKQLRASLGCKKKEEAHHIIPLELRDKNRLVKLAEANGFQFNKAENGICLSKRKPRIHSGSHNEYTESIRKQLDALILIHRQGSDLKWTAELQSDFYAMIKKNYRNLRARKTPLK